MNVFSIHLLRTDARDLERLWQGYLFFLNTPVGPLAISVKSDDPRMLYQLFSVDTRTWSRVDGLSVQLLCKSYITC
jgi:hypothetical protein